MTSKIAVALVAIGLSNTFFFNANAQDEEEMQFTPVELLACTFNEGKGWQDLKALTTRFNKWAEKNDPDYSYWIFSPRFNESNSTDFAWIGGWSSGRALGDGYNAWVDGDHELGEMFEETVDCVTSVSASTPIYVPSADWVTEEEGVVWFNRCRLEEGYTVFDAVTAHREMDKKLAEMGNLNSSGASWAFLPVFAFFDLTKLDYWHVQSWPSYTGLGARFDNYFTKAGRELVADTLDGVVECDAPNVYDFQLQRTGNAR